METLLLTIGFIGVVILLLTPWVKAGATVSILSIFGYFYIAGVDSWTPIALLILGLLLIIGEVFVPDFGLIGILGVFSVAGGLYLTTGDFGLMIRDLSIALLTSAALIFILIRSGYSLSNLSKLVLHTTSKEPIEIEESEEKPHLVVGLTGESVTPLRPSGKAEFDGFVQPYDVLSGQGHINKGTKVIIQEIHGTKIVVRKIKNIKG